MSPPDLFLQQRGALSPEECTRWTAGVYAGRAAWTPCFEGVQFTLGRAYYTHLEEGRDQQYFATAWASDAVVERALPGMQARLRAILARVLDAPVSPRPGWCGPGVHIFPAAGWLSQHGGDIHFDTEGLGEEELAARCPALSAIFMLQPPRSGGGLRVWDALWDGAADEAALATTTRDTVADYAAGDLVLIDSYRLHQIQPFDGGRDRVSITVHLVWADRGWRAWF